MANTNPNDRDDRTGRGILDVIRHVVETLQEIEREEEHSGRGVGRASRDRVRTDYGFSARIGSERERENRSGTDARTDTSEPEYIVEVRHADDEMVVTADLPDVEREELVVGVDPDTNALVIAVSRADDRAGGRADEVVERIPLSWDAISVADTSFNNGIFEIRLQPAEGSDP